MYLIFDIFGGLLPETSRKTRKVVEEGGFSRKPGELNGFEDE
jgi:hypothetical protein